MTFFENLNVDINSTISLSKNKHSVNKNQLTVKNNMNGPFNSYADSVEYAKQKVNLKSVIISACNTIFNDLDNIILDIKTQTDDEVIFKLKRKIFGTIEIYSHFFKLGHIPRTTIINILTVLLRLPTGDNTSYTGSLYEEEIEAIYIIWKIINHLKSAQEIFVLFDSYIKIERKKPWSKRFLFMIDDLIEYNRLNIVSNPGLTNQQSLSMFLEIPLITTTQSNYNQTTDLKFNTNQYKTQTNQSNKINNFRNNKQLESNKQIESNKQSEYTKPTDDFVEIKYNSVKKNKGATIPANKYPNIKPTKLQSINTIPKNTIPKNNIPKNTIPEKSFNIYDTLNDESEPDESDNSEADESDELDTTNQMKTNENTELIVDKSDLTAEQENELTNLVIKSRKSDIYNNINTYDINNKNNLLLFLIKDIIEYNEHIENHMNNISYTLKQIEDNGKYEIGELLSKTLTMSIINLADISIDVPFAHMNFCNIFKYIFKYYPNLCLKIILPKNNQSANTMVEFNKLSKLYNNQVVFV
jgi:hypothetical protein